MFVIIGWVVALGCVFGVFIAHGGNISVVLKALPFEMLTIMGAALVAFSANNQMKVLKASAAAPVLVEFFSRAQRTAGPIA